MSILVQCHVWYLAFVPKFIYIFNKNILTFTIQILLPDSLFNSCVAKTSINWSISHYLQSGATSPKAHPYEQKETYGTANYHQTVKRKLMSKTFEVTFSACVHCKLFMTLVMKSFYSERSSKDLLSLSLFIFSLIWGNVFHLLYLSSP